MFEKTRDSYKPFDYPWCFEAFQLAQRMHWLPREVPLHEDISDWKTKLTVSERNLLTQVQLFLANADTDIGKLYLDVYSRYLHLPELRMVISTFAAAEAVHMESYSLTIDTLGMPEDSYSEFLRIPEMREKHEFLFAERASILNQTQKFLVELAVGSAFGEGMALFSAFALILSFQLRGLMLGLGQLTKFIAKDETFHAGTMIKVFNTIKNEHPEVWTEELIGTIVDAGKEAVRLEDHFINLAFEMGDLPNLTATQLKVYVRYIHDRRCSEIGLPGSFDIEENPLPWMDLLLGSPELANFFEVRSTSYSKASLSGSWAEAWGHYDEVKSG